MELDTAVTSIPADLCRKQGASGQQSTKWVSFLMQVCVCLPGCKPQINQSSLKSHMCMPSPCVHLKAQSLAAGVMLQGNC